MTLWHGCYNDSWQGVIVSEAFAHPAKFSRGLIRRIYEHMLAAGYLAPGDAVIDPFGGVALGGLDAMSMGLHYTGVELEPRFVDIGRGYDCPGFTRADWRRFHHRIARINYKQTPGGEIHYCPQCQAALAEVPKKRRIPTADAHHYQGNIEKWRRDLAMLGDRVGTARLLQGDSRRLLEVVGAGMAGVVSSPPYEVDALGHSRGKAGEAREATGNYKQGYTANDLIATAYGLTPGQLGSMPSGDYAAAVISSPPFSGDKNLMAVNGQGVRSDMVARRGMVESDTQQSPGNLATLRADEAGFTAAVSSPPYADAVNGGEGPGARHDPIYHNGDNAYKASSDNGYGATAGQLGRMAGDGFEAAVSSPPYEASVTRERSGIDYAKFANPNKHVPGAGAIGANTVAAFEYGSTPANIGNDTGGTFWAAARLICEQTYAALRPGGYAVFVTKDFVRRGQRVPFSDQWEALCVAVGFEPVERIRALLTEEHGHQLDIFGGTHPKGIKRASFFRRLYEKKYPENAIDWEYVLILRKPTRAPANGARSDT